MEPCDHRTSPVDFQFRYDPETEDIETIRTIIQKTGFFHDYEVAVAVELIEERLQKGPYSGYEFVFLESDGKVLGYACYGLIPCTKNSYDLYWIAVEPDFQKKGLGKIILTETEKLIRHNGGKRVYIDTSDSSKYQKTFSFYKNNGYGLVSRLEDFYAEGDGKAVFMKMVL
ncbi:MAG: GNAT family N-acetyltransferase [Proteobacteria bacterium]|nr:GNAT family N-acetyltransferase [Pseudomonadota bacterium]